MLYRKLGSTGIKSSVLSLGGWLNTSATTQDRFEELMNFAYSNGINFFDTAEIYGKGLSEKTIGNIISKLKWPRESYMICDKVFWGGESVTANGLNKKHIRDGCDKSLQNLRLDYIDFYVCHRPDYDTPIIETVCAMNTLIQQGKILYWGTSEWTNEQILEAYHVAKKNNLIGPSLEQFEYNMFNRRRCETLYPCIQKLGVAATTTMPLSHGILAGIYTKGIPANSRAYSQIWLKEHLESQEGQNQIEIANQLHQLSTRLDLTLPQLSLAWIIKNTDISSILIGPTNLDQLKENIIAINKTSVLDYTINEKIEKILGNRPTSLSLDNPTYHDVSKYG